MTDPRPHPRPSETTASSGSEVARLEAEIVTLRAQLQASSDRLLAATEREASLLSEVQRRVRNTLAIVRSIFSRTLPADGALEEMANHFRGRLDTLTRYQAFSENLNDRRIDLEQMVRDELQAFQFGYDEMITISGPEVGLHHSTAQILALAFHELATNSIKFGALSAAFTNARLRIAWVVHGTQLTMDWTEKGVSILAEAPLHYGFGRDFIEQGLPYQIGGTSSFTLLPGGLRCAIAFPLETGPARPAGPGSFRLGGALFADEE